MTDNLRTYTDVVRELQVMWRHAVEILDEVYKIAAEQGFYPDLYDLNYARMHVSAIPPFSKTEGEPRVRLHHFERTLDFWYKTNQTHQTRVDGAEQWILCSRSHAEANHYRVYIPSGPGQPLPVHGRLLFKAMDRLHEGPQDLDLVYAITPVYDPTPT
jgi:hypothetical protein